MTRTLLTGLALSLLAPFALLADSPPEREQLTVPPKITLEYLPRPKEKSYNIPDLTGYRPVSQLIKAKVDAPTSVIGRAGYLGVSLVTRDDGKLVVDDLEFASPAEQAGLKVGDVLLQFNDETLTQPVQVREWVQSLSPGERIRLTIIRDGKKQELVTNLAAVSRPMSANTPKAYAGLRTGDMDANGIAIVAVVAGSPAEKAGMKSGDTIRSIDGRAMTAATSLSDQLMDKRPGEMATFTIVRAGQTLDLKIKLVESPDNNPRGGGNGPGGWDSRRSSTWKKSVYRIGVVMIEYPDQKHNPKITTQDWTNSIFSDNSYRETSATGSNVHGSLADYYRELSNGVLKVEGKVFDYIQVSKNRGAYAEPLISRTALLEEAMDKIIAREGRSIIENYDGFFFMYAGGGFPTNRGGLYWPHRSTFSYKGTRIQYFICPEGGNRMGNISVLCHEFGHMLGLPDLYARPENPGSEGLGNWCAMSNQIDGGRPQHFSAWCKEQLGWITPTVIDPTVKQKVILAPIEGTKAECIKVLVKRDGSEYLLLENRCKAGFDLDLPAEGLLIWRVVGNRPILEESHGVDGPSGPRMFMNWVPYPSKANNAFTPFTTPSSKSQLGGGLPVHITNIRRLEDGRITFQIGYEFQ